MNYSITRGNGGVIAWTDEQVAYIIQQYQDGKTLTELGREFGCTFASIRNLLHRKHIKTYGNKHNFPRNEYYFSEINTPEKAYWLGIMFTDGTVGNEKKRDISLGLKDKDHVEKFKNAIGATNHRITEVVDKRFKGNKYLYHFTIKDGQLYSDLIKWGCCQNKTFLITSIPNIPRDYVPHFIRGVFDGDGSIHYLKSTNNYRISFCGARPEFLEDIKKELYLSPDLKLGKNKNGNVYQLQISGSKQVSRVIEYMYKDATEDMWLTRKHDICLKALEWAHSR